MVYRHVSALAAPVPAPAAAASERVAVKDEDGREIVLDADREPREGGAAQCIWLARVRPEDCENIVRYTVLQGKVVKPERQLRGGFDRCRQVASW